MKNINKISTFLISFLILFIMLIGINSIPQKYIKNNIYNSVEKLNEYSEKNIFHKFTQTRTDNIHDLYIMETIFYNSGNQIKDTILPQYNEIRNEKTYINDTFNQMNINHGLDNYTYLTGINIILKPLFILFTLNQIKFIGLFTLIVLIACFIYLCEKNKLRKLWVSFIIGFLFTYSYLTPLSLNESFTLILSLIFSIFILSKENIKNELFIIFGVITAFVDGLSMGSLLFVIPFLTYISKNDKYKDYNEFLNDFVKKISNWIISLFSTFIIKIGLTYFLYKENIISNFYNGVNGKSVISNIGYILYQNITKIFPLKSTNSYSANVIILLLLIFIYMVFLYTYKDKKANINKIKVLSYIITAIVPILYLIFIYKNAYLYSFVTYRNLLGSIMSLALLAIEITNFTKIKLGDSTVS